MTDPIRIPKPGKPSVNQIAGKARTKPATKEIVEGGSGGVSANSIGKATSVAGTQPYGRPLRRSPVHKMITGPERMGSGGAHG